MENINNKRKYFWPRFQLQELPWRNLLFLVCPQSYWTFLLLLLYQGGSSSPCLHPTHLILALELLTHRNCTERRQKKTLPLLSLNENVSLREEEIPWYKSFRSFWHSILLLLAFPDQSPFSNLLLQWLGCRTDTCTTSSVVCKIHTEYYLQKLFTIYSISAKTWKNLKRRRIFTKIYNRWTQSREQEQVLLKETMDTQNNFANLGECNAQCLLCVNTTDI